ncbi:hypothetical protein [Kribbella sancticallisti]|uniref:hypothetical protein n=1 Tax=Kribbella sancticallisti TaxID=460087 RepID=UPI0031CE5A2D
MVGRFNVRPGTGEADWSIWDNAANGLRGSGLHEAEAHRQAAELELQYDAHGYRPAETYQKVDPPKHVQAWQPAGVLVAWVREGGEWLGQVRDDDGRYHWVPGDELREAKDRP